MIDGTAPIRLVAREEAGRLWVEVSGDVDMATAPRLEELVLDGLPDSRGVTLDLSGVGFIDSIGLRSLMRCRQAVGDLVIRRPSGVVRRILVLTRSLDQFVIEEADQGS